MKLDDHFKSAMQQAVENEPAVVDPRGRFDARLARVRRVRLIGSLAGAAALIAAAAVIVPRLLPETSTPVPSASGSTSTPSESQKPTPGTVDTSGWSTYEGNGWALKAAPGWSAQWFEGDTEFVPAGYSGTAVGKPTFALIVRPEAEAYTAVEFPQGGETTEGTWNDGHKYRQWHPTSASEHGSETVFEFAGASCLGGTGCPGAQYRALHVIYHASTPELWNDFVRFADAMFDSIHFTEPVQTKYGSVSPGVDYGPFTRAVIDFMDARMIKRGAEPYLGAAAKESYTRNEGGLALYSPTSNPHYANYEIMSVKHVEGNLEQATYIVKIVEEYTGTSGPVDVFYERLGVGSGGTEGYSITNALRCKNDACS